VFTLERVVGFIDRNSTGRNLVLSIVASIVIIAIMSIATQTLVYDVYGDFTMPDTRFGYTFSDVQTAFNAIGAEGLQIWAIAHAPDFLFPLAYSFSMMFGIILELRKAGMNSGMYRMIIFIPLAGGIADYIENILILTQIGVYPNLSEIVIAIASIVTLAKWVFLILGFIVIFGFLILIVIKRLTSKSNGN
jgi:hypothetical protein